MKHILLFACSIALFISVKAQESKTTSPIIFIYDASGSMWGQLEGRTKMDIATEVLSKSVNSLPETQQIGLVAYGHRHKSDCEDVEFLVNSKNLNKSAVIQSLKGIKPLGKTPLAYSANLVINHLTEAQTKATIILVTDGIESCDGNICDVIKSAREKGIDFKLHIIGFGLKEEDREQLVCAAKEGNGQYYDAANMEGLTDVLQQATSTPVDEPEPNISVYATKNGKSVDALVKAFESTSKKQMKVARTYGDTGFLYLPPGKYYLEVSPLENTNVSGIIVPEMVSLKGTKIHKTVSFDSGKLKVNTLNNGTGWDATVNVYSEGTKNRVAGGRTYGRVKEFELSPGLYDVELQAVANMEGLQTTNRQTHIEIKPNGTSEVEHNFLSGIAIIGIKKGEDLVDATVNIVEVNSKKHIAGGRTYTSPNSNPKKFILNPGKYEVTMETLGAHKGKKETFVITIEQGKTLEKVILF